MQNTEEYDEPTAWDGDEPSLEQFEWYTCNGLGIEMDGEDDESDSR